MDIDELIATAQPRIERVRICARGDLVAAHQAAVRDLDEAVRGDDSLAGSPEVHEAAERVRAIEEEQEASTVEIAIHAVSRRKWADLLAKHPPSNEQRRAGLDHDPDTFPIAVVAACSEDVTEEQARQLADVLPPGEWNKLWATAFGLNLTETPHPKLAAATELLQANGRSSTTSAHEASPEAGSLAGSGEQ